MNSSRKPGFLAKLIYMLTPRQKRQLVMLILLMIIGMLFEMMGLGILIPSLVVIVDPDISTSYPALRPYLNMIGNPSQQQLVIYGMLSLVAIYIVKSAFLIFLSWKQSRFSAELSANLSQRLFDGYLKQPYIFHLQRNSALLIRNIQGEINQFADVSRSVINVSIELSALIGVASILVFAEPAGAISVTAFLVVLSLLFQRLTKKRLLFWGKFRQLHDGAMNQHLMQGLSGIKDVKLMGREKYFVSRFAYHSNENAKIFTNQYALKQLPRMYLELLAVVALAAIIIIFILQGKPLGLLIPTIGIFMAAAFRMIPCFYRIMGATQQIRYARPVVDVLYNEFQAVNAAAEENAKMPDTIRFEKIIEIKGLSFRYPQTSNWVIKNINIHIERGKSIGFIGQSGSGKTTFINLLIGLLEPQKGSIEVDGKNINSGTRSWQNQIGYIPQTIYLTDDTLRHNIAFGIEENKIDDAAIAHAVKAAQLDEFISELPDGLSTSVGERGVRISGGQRQRIGIARALYHYPTVLVMDEATSALDSITEKEIMKSIDFLKNEKITILIIAHRLSTLTNCDWIYKFEKGSIFAEGKPVDMIGEKVK
jgi:ABC-type multidrug transport system fused ATPase/permease subunit